MQAISRTSSIASLSFSSGERCQNSNPDLFPCSGDASTVSSPPNTETRLGLAERIRRFCPKYAASVAADDYNERHRTMVLTMDKNTAIKSGYVFKKTSKSPKWKKRWVVLRSHELAIYKDDREYELKNLILLEKVVSVKMNSCKKRDNVITLTLSDDSIFCLDVILDKNSPSISSLYGTEKPSFLTTPLSASTCAEPTETCAYLKNVLDWMSSLERLVRLHRPLPAIQ